MMNPTTVSKCAVRRAALWVLIATGSVVPLFVQAAEADLYPQGYRQWVHIKSALITSAHPAAKSEGGLHHIYANRKAFEGYASGNFADGSVVVYELLATDEKDGVVSEGSRRRLDVMVKDSSRFSATGGWGFARYMDSSEAGNVLGASDAAACFACHARASGQGDVFSRMR